MGRRNESVEAFRAHLAAIPVNIRAKVAIELVRQAARLITLQRAANTDRTGALDASIEAQLMPLGTRIYVRAGGPLTTKPVRISKKGNAPQYDYALAYEFGRKGQPARPFFYPSYRLLKGSMATAIGRAAAKAVRENGKGGALPQIGHGGE